MSVSSLQVLLSRRTAAFLLSALLALSAGSQPRVRFAGTATDLTAATGPVGEALDLPAPPPAKSALRAAASGMQYSTAPEEELFTDDGTPDGTGILADGLMLVNRLTPSAYPVRLLRVRLYFVSFRNQPNPVGQRVRLVVFADPEGRGRPPERPRLLVDEWVQISQLGFADFNVSGVLIERGDLYVGYQAPRPHNGVGFPTDTSSPPQQRGFFSEDDGATFGGPVEFADGQRFNLLMRAVVRREAPGAGEDTEELRVDDGTIEAGMVRDGAIYVNRLTPSRYPARLTGVRLYVPWIEGRPSPVGKSVRLVAFRDPSGNGRPPERVVFDLERELRVSDYGRFLDVDVDGPVIESGDVYVGYQAPNPHDGVAFAVDLNGPPGQRTFRSTDGGQSFTGPIEVTFQGRTGPANLAVRAVVHYSPTEDPGEPPAFRVAAEPSSVDLTETDGEEEIQLFVLAGEELDGEIALRAATDPPNVPVQLELTADKVNVGGSARLKLSRLEQFDDDLFQVVVTATSGKKGERPFLLSIPVYRWRLLAQALIGPGGGTLAGGETEVTVAPGAFPVSTMLRLLTGRPATGFEGHRSERVYRLEGLPEEVTGELRFQIRERQKSAWRTAADEPAPLAAVQIEKLDAEGRPQSATHLLPASGSSVTLKAVEFKLVRRVSAWMLTGYYAADTPQGHFRIFYPYGYGDAARRIGELLEEAFIRLVAEVGLKNLERDLGEYLRWALPGVDIGVGGYPIQVTLKKLGDELDGIADRSTLSFNTLRLGSPEAIEAFASTPGHELMHLVQAVYGGVSPWRPGPYAGLGYTWLWMDEAISTWFEPIAIGTPDYIPDTVRPDPNRSGSNQSDNYKSFTSRGLLRVPNLRSPQQEHGYGASVFLTDLARRVPNLIPQLLARRNPGQDPLEALLQVLGGPERLAAEWSLFAGNYLAGNIYPGRHFPTFFDLLPANSAETWAPFARSALDSHRRFYWAESDLSIATFSINVRSIKELPELTDGVYLAAKLDAPTDAVDLYGFEFNRDSSSSLGKKPRGELLLFPNTAELEAGRKTVLLAVVRRGATLEAKPTALSVAVELAPPEAKIRGYRDFTGVIGASYEFTTVNRNIEKDATYTWNFAGVTKQGRTVQHSWDRAGDHPVTLTVQSGKHTLTDRLTFKVAPPSGPVKAEVLFEVYRRVRVLGSWSNQKCQSYKIAIFDPQNKLVESGESIARNGAYETTLTVADGYSYAVDYTYTTICRDSGRRTGKFDVKGGRINHVPVETPPCEQ